MTHAKWINSLRWAARITSLISIGLLLAFLVGEGEWPPRLTLLEAFGMLLFPGGVIVGMIVGWWREGLGGTIAIASLCTFYLEHLVVWHDLPSEPWFLFFALPGFLFALTWLFAHGHGNDPIPPQQMRHA